VTIEYYKNAESPPTALTWYDDADAVIDFSAGFTFTAKIGVPGQTAVLSVTTGITGAATAPNVTINWAAGAFSSVTPNEYALQVTARETSTTKDRELQLPFTLKASVS
jgi:hypothetical protein